AAVDAGAQRHAVGVGVRAGHVRRRRGEGVVTQLARRLAVKRAHVRGLHRRIRVLARARALEGIAAGPDLALHVAGLAADAVEILEAVEMGLELVVGHAPVLAGTVLGQLLLAVAGERAAARLEVPGQEAPGDAVPVHRCAADAFAREERPHLVHRPRRLADRG